MEFSEKFIDRNIAELAETYDKIKGANTNIYRIAPDFIDGLKPVQRRAIYIMYLKDRGEKFRKLATISGDTFGRVHPHSPTSIEDAVVNIAQEWRNIIPLIEGEGNFGCHDDITEVLTREGWKLFKDITKKDLLASVNPDTDEIIFEHPTEIFDYEYDGEMIVGKHKSLDFKVTPNHKMLVKKFDNFVFIEAKNLCENSKVIFVSNIEIENVSTGIENTNYISSEHYRGHVYCAEVPTYHTLITRRNGIVLISGNSISGDVAGASRYIKARLSKYSTACFFEDWKDSVVDMEMGYDEETLMPLYLPAKYPNVLLNGCLGIGYGTASNIPCFNFREVVEATILLMKHPDAPIVLIPDSPTGADIIETDFSKMCNEGRGAYTQRCTYDVDPENNIITITSLPDLVTANNIREKIADIKEKNGLSELISMNDLSGKAIEIQLMIRDDVNPYKFIRKLIKEVAGLEKVYPVNITVTNDYESIDYSIRDLLLEWIKYRREQKRVVVSNKRTKLFGEQRTNDIKIFLLNENNLEETVKIFRTSKNLADIQKNLLERYKHSEIRMDSVQAKTLSNMRFAELSIESYENCLKRREELYKEIEEVENILNSENGIDNIIIAELRDGIKRFGTDRKSNVVPYKISVSSDVEGYCVLQLSSDGTILRRVATNADEEPIPTDSNGFAVLIDNDSSFILIDDNGHHTFVRAKDIPIDSEVPVNRYAKKSLDGNIIAMLPSDSEKCCTLISKMGTVKRIRISDIGPSKKPCISLDTGDKIVRGIVLAQNTSRELLVYTKEGYGQRLENTSIKITSPLAKGGNGFKLHPDDEICGVFAINPDENAYLLYTTVKGKQRLNNIEYLPVRSSKHDSMVSLISLSDRDRLLSVIGCNRFDKATLFFADGSNETVDVSKMKESTMSELPKKLVSKDMTSSSSNVVKVKLV